MTEKYSISRQKAEVAFSNIQAPFFAKDKAMDELDSITQSREAKTLRLREARLAKEESDRISATSALIAKRARAR
ncbi:MULTISPECIES: hypothetical protein [Rhizobium/Agrobacterium group]|uniref:Uncharacterized protein n=1 Tax=Agrobacterium arsenijevicii TaxID=1585697 RepID=A0ABR5D1Z1_9HYPH|nr:MULTISPECIES: hypothetical protein [unclassified Rhizobium]KJF71080.1 hypothetical protein RP75_22975 [Agrobacterium arsenijevicii]MDH7804456.1 hypothetical protein [Rhizobium sp. AN70]